MKKDTQEPYLKIYTPLFRVSPNIVKPYLRPEQLLIFTSLKYGESRHGESRASIQALYEDCGHDISCPSRATYYRFKNYIRDTIGFAFENLGWTTNAELDEKYSSIRMFKVTVSDSPKNLLEGCENSFAMLYEEEWEVLRDYVKARNKGVLLQVFLTIVSYIYPRKPGQTIEFSPMATYMSLERLAKETKLSVPTVINAVHTLVDAGMLACKNYGKFVNDNGVIVNTPNVYARPQIDGSEKEEMFAKAHLMLKSYNVSDRKLRYEY